MLVRGANGGEPGQVPWPEDLPEGFLEVDGDWRCIHVNRRALHLLQKNAPDVAGRALWEVFSHPGEQVVWLQAQHAASERRPVRAEIFHPPTLRWLDVHLVPGRDGVRIFIVDITEQKHRDEQYSRAVEVERQARAETERLRSALAECEARLAAIEAASPYGTFRCGLDGSMRSAGSGYLDLLQLSLDDARALGWLRRLAPDERDHAQREWRRVTSGTAPWQQTHHYLLADGGHASLTLRARPLRDASGQLVEWAGIILDAAEVPGAAAPDRPWRELVEASPIGFAIKDAEGRYLAANRRMHEMCGVRALAGLRDDELPGEGRTRLGTLDAQAKKHGIAQVRHECAGPHGTSPCLSVRFPFADASGRSLVASVSIDMGARNGDPSKDLAGERAGAALAGTIALDFHNLITPIIGSLAPALDELPRGDALRLPLQQGVDAAERAMRLTSQLLSWSGRAPSRVRRVDVVDELKKMGELVELLIEENVKLLIQPEQGTPPVDADMTQVQQLIMQLVLNAAEAIGENGGEVKVITGPVLVGKNYAQQPWIAERIEPGRYTSLEVRDDGCGMDAAVKQHAFDPYFSTKVGSRGLGLSAVLGIVRAHKGAIEVSSQPGKGTAVRVLLPASKRGSAQRSPPSASQELMGAGDLLIVDEDAKRRRTLPRALRRYGYTVHAADAATMDVVLGGLKGPLLAALVGLPLDAGVLDKIRALAPDVPRLVFVDEEAEEGGVQLGGEEELIVRRPCSTAEIAGHIKAIGRARA